MAVAIGSDHPTGIGVKHGWRRVGQPMLASRTHGNVVYELDERPALNVYLELLDPPAAAHTGAGDFTRFSQTHPLGISRRAGEEHVRFVSTADFDGRALQPHPWHGRVSQPDPRPARHRLAASAYYAAAMPTFARPAVMGVLNVTPDSFSDGGEHMDAEDAVAHAVRMVGEGAALVDVGGESTRPGAAPVAEEEELRRVMPVVEALGASKNVPFSIDTSKAAVARAATAAGARFVNDVTALRGDPGMPEVVAAAGAEVCLVHMLGEPRTMQDDPRYGDVVSDVSAFLEERLAFAVAEGIAEERVWLDPGIGFGKTLEHNLELLRRLDEIVALGRPVIVGASRKRFIGTLTGRAEHERAAGTVAVNVIAFERGAHMFRVHDVAATRDALMVASATLS